jgi:hypothetical protein
MLKQFFAAFALCGAMMPAGAGDLRHSSLSRGDRDQSAGGVRRATVTEKPQRARTRKDGR